LDIVKSLSGPASLIGAGKPVLLKIRHKNFINNFIVPPGRKGKAGLIFIYFALYSGRQSAGNFIFYRINFEKSILKNTLIIND